MNKLQPAIDPIIAAADDLLGARPDSIEIVGGGRNSRVYRVEIRGKQFALKRYPSVSDDLRDRLGTEVEALRLLATRGLSNIPRVIAIDRERNFVLLSWLDGAPVTSVSDFDIDQAAAFLKIIHEMRGCAATTFATRS